MRNSFVSWLTAAVMVCGFSIAGLNTANAESVMRTCASEWKQAQAGGTTGGQAWPQFLAQCRTRQGAATAPTAAPAPPPQSGSLFPWSQPSTPTSTAASNVGAPATGQSVMSSAQANGKTPRLLERPPARRGHSFCRNAARTKPPPLRLREVSFPPRPRRPLLSQDLCSRGGNNRRPRPRPHRAAPRPRPCRRANTQRSSGRVLAARRPPSCGSTRRRASTTIREPATTATPSRAHICARLTRARAAIVRRGTANLRRRLIRG